MKHMPAGAFSSVPMTISFLPLGQDLPARRLRPEPGQAGQIVSVNHDVMQSDRHAGSMRGTLDRIPETRCSAADGPIAGGHTTRQRPDRVINLIPRQPVNPAS
jgi:hypothetical protein